MTTGHTKAEYEFAFTREREHHYAMVDSFEARCGYALEPARLEPAARILACPLKTHPPNWQHGRVIYAAVSQYLADAQLGFVHLLDIGTAKGFSALCMLWAMQDAGVDGVVTSVDVVDPLARVKRNTVAELDGFKNLAELLAPWPEWTTLELLKSTGVDYLSASPERIHCAFVDGQHCGSVVLQEGTLLAARQQPGDLVIFDDVQNPDVSVAVVNLVDRYRLTYLTVRPHRQYAIGVRW